MPSPDLHFFAVPLAISHISYKSAVGMPTAAVFDEFLKIHPKAKVILTIRDSPEEWVESFQNTIIQMYQLPYWYVWVNQLCGGPIGHISKVKLRNSGKNRTFRLFSQYFTFDLKVFDQCSKQLLKRATVLPKIN